MEYVVVSDEQTTVHELRTMVREFVDARDWRQFHAPKNISMALAIEAAELMEHFQWLTIEQSRAVVEDEAA
ncbi:MAG: nucleotide pyrophosphohydrolase, partial [Planctomycetota bacterium]